MFTLFINVVNMFCMVAPNESQDIKDFSHCPTIVDFGRVLLGVVQLGFWVS
jgi:hypothetical protein